MPALDTQLARLVLIAVWCACVLAGCDGNAPAHDAGAILPGGDGVIVTGSQIRIDLTSDRGKALASHGGFVFVEAPRVLVINAAGTVRAYSSICTGDACDVDRFVEGALRCACDGSAFGASGVPVQGPARAPLSRYNVTRSGEVVTVALASSDPGPDPEPEPPPYGY